MFGVAQVLQRGEHLFGLFRLLHHVGKDHHQRAAVDGIGHLVQAFSQVGGPVQAGIFDALAELREQPAVVHRARFGVGIQQDIVVEEGEAVGVALFAQGVHQHGGGLGGETELVEVLVLIGLLFVPGVVHRGRGIHHDLAAQVGFFLEPLDEQLVRAAVHFPVNVAGTFAGVVQPMLGKLDRKTVERAAVQADDKTFTIWAANC